MTNQSVRPVTQLKRDFIQFCITGPQTPDKQLPATQGELTEMWIAFRDEVVGEELATLKKIQVDHIRSAPPPYLWPDGTVHIFHRK